MYGCISKSGENVEGGETAKWINRSQGAVKCFVENVTNSSASTQLGCFDVAYGPIDGGAVRRRKFGDDVKQSLALNVEFSRLTVKNIH